MQRETGSFFNMKGALARISNTPRVGESGFPIYVEVQGSDLLPALGTTKALLVNRGGILTSKEQREPVDGPRKVSTFEKIMIWGRSEMDYMTPTRRVSAKSSYERDTGDWFAILQ